MKHIASVFLFSCLVGCVANDLTNSEDQLTPKKLGSTLMHTIDVEGLPAVFVGQDRNGMGIGIFQSESNAPYVSLRDEDSDGIFDFIEYVVLDSEGTMLKSVEDYGFDGQADLIVDYAARSARVFIDGKWYPVDGIDTDQEKTVNVSGKVRPLREVVDELRNGAI